MDTRRRWIINTNSARNWRTKRKKNKYGFWPEIANKIPGRTPRQCYDRWNKYIKLKIKKGPWTPEEDERLLQAVGVHGTENWPKIAKEIPDRTARQCRGHWNTCHNPNLNKGPWTEEEDRIIIERQRELGNQWAKIALFLQGRSDYSVKNRYNHLKKKEREETRNHQGQYVHGIFGGEFNLPDISGGEFNLSDISGGEFNLSDISGEEFNAQNTQEQPTIHQQLQLEQSYADLIATYHDLSSATEYHKRKLYENLGLPFDLWQRFF